MNWRKFFNLEVIGFLVVMGLCIYVYINYDKKRPKIVEPVYEDYFEEVRNYRPPPPPKRKRQPKRGQWKSENMCREIFERLFNRSFPSVRPPFLKNPVTGQNLELDGYCESLKLAFEYDGIQHSKYNKHFHRNSDEFIYQVTKDDYKTKKCKLEGIDLVRIPHYIVRENLEDYIVKELKRIGRL